MSTVTNKLQTASAMFNDYDTSNLLLGFNSFIDGTITAAAGSGVLLAGMVMGRVAATGKITPCVVSATDGSQYPIGVCIQTQTVADGASALIPLVNKGRVAESKIDFLGAETLATVVKITTTEPADYAQTTYRDLLNNLGLILMGGIELTGVDNS
jgi:hypothetical protein